MFLERGMSKAWARRERTTVPWARYEWGVNEAWGRRERSTTIHQGPAGWRLALGPVIKTNEPKNCTSLTSATKSNQKLLNFFIEQTDPKPPPPPPPPATSWHWELSETGWWPEGILSHRQALIGDNSSSSLSSLSSLSKSSLSSLWCRFVMPKLTPTTICKPTLVSSPSGPKFHALTMLMKIKYCK